MDFGIILKMLIMACGVYMIYWAVQMKTTHQIPQMLVGKGFPTDRAKDPEGFMKVTFPLTMGMGIILLAVGVMGALEVFVGYYPHPDHARSTYALWHVSAEGTEEVSDRFRR